MANTFTKYFGILISTICLRNVAAFLLNSPTEAACFENLKGKAPRCQFETSIFPELKTMKADVEVLQAQFITIETQAIKKLRQEIDWLSVRLNGKENSGVAEVYQNGHWGAICYNGWDDNDANVFCKTIGFHKGIATDIGVTTKPYLMSSVSCSGTEKSVFDCNRLTNLTVSPCSNNNAATVKCDIDIRLNGSFDNNRGRVEITHRGQWGTICDDNWSDNDATVVCRMLGFNNGGRAVSDATFGPGNGLVWLDNVVCTGGETTLMDCATSSFGQHNCVHPNDASVVCN